MLRIPTGLRAAVTMDTVIRPSVPVCTNRRFLTLIPALCFPARRGTISMLLKFTLPSSRRSILQMFAVLKGRLYIHYSLNYISTFGLFSSRFHFLLKVHNEKNFFSLFFPLIYIYIFLSSVAAVSVAKAKFHYQAIFTKLTLLYNFETA